jgi:hypothetical protein
MSKYGKQYHLLAAKDQHGCKTNVVGGVNINTCNNFLLLPPGMKRLRNPEERWGDLTVFTMLAR